jgi:hypothetical protein
MLIIQWSVVRLMRFHIRNDQEEWIALVFLNKSTRLLLQKNRFGDFKRQVTDGILGEGSVSLIRDMAAFYQKATVVTDAFSRNPFSISALFLSFITQLPFTHVSGVVIFVAQEFSERPRRSRKRNVITYTSVGMRPRSGEKRSSRRRAKRLGHISSFKNC